jgi:hypothetical protein
MGTHTIHTNATEATITITRLADEFSPKRSLTYSTTTTGRFAQESAEIHAMAAQMEPWGSFDPYQEVQQLFSLLYSVHTCNGVDCDCLCPNPVTL